MNLHRKAFNLSYVLMVLVIDYRVLMHINRMVPLNANTGTKLMSALLSWLNLVFPCNFGTLLLSRPSTLLTDFPLKVSTTSLIFSFYSEHHQITPCLKFLGVVVIRAYILIIPTNFNFALFPDFPWLSLRLPWISLPSS